MANAPVNGKLDAESVKSWRREMGYSQEDAATALGCSRRSLVTWESGSGEVPLYIGLAMSALCMQLRPFGTGPAKIEGEGEE